MMVVKVAGGAVVERAVVERKVRRLMDAGEEGRKMREKASWAQQAAKAAVSDGGTSRLALMKLVEELQRCVNYCLASFCFKTGKVCRPTATTHVDTNPAKVCKTIMPCAKHT
jgi:hypothetical protein